MKKSFITYGPGVKRLMERFFFLFKGEYCQSEEVSDVDNFASIVPGEAAASLTEAGYNFDEASNIVYQFPVQEDIMEFIADVTAGISASILDTMTVEVLNDDVLVISEVCLFSLLQPSHYFLSVVCSSVL